jgi:hypothetical protein
MKSSRRVQVECKGEVYTLTVDDAGTEPAVIFAATVYFRYPARLLPLSSTRSVDLQMASCSTNDAAVDYRATGYSMLHIIHDAWLEELLIPGIYANHC